MKKLVFALCASVSVLGAAQVRAAPAVPPECAEIKNPNAKSLCADAVRQLADGRIDLSLTIMRKAIMTSPREGGLRILSGIILLRSGNAPAAERELRQARLSGVGDGNVLPYLFRAMLARHEEIQLLNEFADPAPGSADPLSVEILHGRALALQSLGRLDEAAVAMDRSLYGRRVPSALRDRAELATLQKDFALANKLVDEGLQLDPANNPLLLAKLDLLARSNDTGRTLAFADQILKLYPENVQARVVRIETFLKLNQDGKARAENDLIVARTPKAWVGRYFKAVLLARARDPKSAWQIILVLPPEFVKAYPQYAIQMSAIAEANGNIESAASILGSALSAAPDRLDVRMRLATLRLNQDNVQTAQGLMSPVKDTTDPQAQKLLAQIRARIAKNRAF